MSWWWFKFDHGPRGCGRERELRAVVGFVAASTVEDLYFLIAEVGNPHRAHVLHSRCPVRVVTFDAADGIGYPGAASVCNQDSVLTAYRPALDDPDWQLFSPMIAKEAFLPMSKEERKANLDYEERILVERSDRGVL